MRLMSRWRQMDASCGGFLDGKIGHDQAGHAAVADVGNVLLESVAIHDGVTHHRYEGALTFGATSPSVFRISANLILCASARV